MSTPHRIIPLLESAYATLQDAQAHVDAQGRGTGSLARDLDSLRWSLGDLIAEYRDDLPTNDETLV